MGGILTDRSGNAEAARICKPITLVDLFGADVVHEPAWPAIVEDRS